MNAIKRKRIKNKKMYLHQLHRYKEVMAVGAISSTLFLYLATSASAVTLQQAKSDLGLLEQIQGFINDFKLFVQGGLYGGTTSTVQSVNGSTNTPDLGQAFEEIMSSGSLPPDYSAATNLENGLPNSYAIREDAAKQSQRVGALATAQIQTLSGTAQNNTSARLQLSTDSVDDSQFSSDDSQTSDTSQRILRNISSQQKSLAYIAHLQTQEAVAARQDRALQLTVAAQAADSLDAANIRDRQQTMSAGNAALAQQAGLTMPGGAVIGQ